MMNRRIFFKNLVKSVAFTPFLIKDLSANIMQNDVNNKINKNLHTPPDIYLDNKDKNELLSVRNKLKLVQRHIGYGNFNLISFDRMIKVARYAAKIERFNKKELDFLESIFYYNPSAHGFFGHRTSSNITNIIKSREVVKIPRTGHYLFKGQPEKTYYEMKKDIGNTIILTSGVRSIIKQTKLFIDKVYKTKGNLSVASRSLAPPAFTYHSIGDFDVGKKGYGYANFTERFTLTQEFLEMKKLSYIEMRYTVNNKDGVRYEPWHIKVI